jgi:hypothetical protein
MKPIAWYDPTNGMVSTDKDSPLFTPLGQVWPLYPQSEQEPVAYINVEQRKLEWAKYMSWDTPTVVNLPKIPLYTTPPQCTKQEPVAWISPKELLVMRGNAYAGAKDWRVNLGLEPEEGDVGLYTTPSQRTWVGLTRDEILEARWHNKSSYKFARVLEAKLKEKNT